MAKLAPLDDTITLDALDRDSFPIYRRLRGEAPVCRIKAAGRTFLTKAADTKSAKNNPEIFSSDDPNSSAFSVLLNATDPIPETQICANIKIAIGGGINEPRDALNTILFGLLTNPDQLVEVKRYADWDKAFEDGVRWVAPISASSRVVTEDTEIRGCVIPKGRHRHDHSGQRQPGRGGDRERRGL